MRRIVNHTRNKGQVITETMMLTSETMIDEQYFDAMNNDIGHSDSF